jgi:hypothetical protein
MKIRLASLLFRHLVLAVLAPCFLPTNEANANQFAFGLIQVTITAEPYPNIPITSATCDLNISTYDYTALQAFNDDVTVQATIVGNYITCTPTATYYWSLTNLTGTIGIGYSISAQNGSIITRSTSGNIGSILTSTTGTTNLNFSTLF